MRFFFKEPAFPFVFLKKENELQQEINITLEKPIFWILFELH